ncbi:hypothetical protein M422DRAFT_256185 [Sphaerobolus stellatus SS14]|uniref:Alpha-type protein kinase domain-containing protein n=1 Tax=Sphaerobolus stellatus (strain SS14) TaxID=990650 RepID=A0A0C9V127_SPHS4|nr:hypothetical protein M422DRAFT_256185 [Sphaerobolus stellatus SS14]
MPTCSDCGISFLKLPDGTTCGLCTRLEGKSGAERQAILLLAQCRGCGVAYKDFKRLICGRCSALGMRAEDTFEEEVGDNDVGSINAAELGAQGSMSMDKLLDRAEHHRNPTTEFRLAKQPKNSGLQKADNYKTTKHLAHKTASQQQKLSKSQVASAEIQFIIYMRMSRNGHRSQSISSGTVSFNVSRALKVVDTFNQMLCAAEEALVFDLDETEDDSELEEVETVHSQKCKKKQRSPHPKKRRKSHKRDSDSELDEDEEEFNSEDMESESESEAIVREAARVTRSMSSRQKKTLDAIKSEGSVIIETATILAQEEPTEIGHEPFLTPYHCRPHFKTSCYDLYYFETSCIVMRDGEIFLHSSNVKEMMVVHKNWPAYRHAGQGAVGGYLGNGTRKWAFKGYTYQGEYALFILGGLHFFSGVTESFNHAAFEEELKNVMKAEYHLKIFKQRAAHYNVTLPKIRYNADGAFIGKMIIQNDRDEVPKPSYGTPDTRSMLYATFLAAPLLNMKGCTEVRFTDNQGKGHDMCEEEMGQIIAAFTHAVLVDSDHMVIVTDIQGVFLANKELVLYDPQVHTVCSHWNPLGDDGRKIINAFLRQHKCNNYCRKLHLEGASPESVTPRTILPDASVPEFPQPPRLFAPIGSLKLQSTDGNTMASTVPINNTEISPVVTGCKAVAMVPAVIRRQDGPLRIGFSPTKY